MIKQSFPDLPKDVAPRLHAVAATENRSPSQIANVALKTLLDMSAAARRAILAIDEMADDGERQFAAKAIGRAALAAYENIIDARHSKTSLKLNTEEAIDAEAVRLCRT